MLSFVLSVVPVCGMIPAIGGGLAFADGKAARKIEFKNHENSNLPINITVGEKKSLTLDIDKREKVYDGNPFDAKTKTKKAKPA